MEQLLYIITRGIAIGILVSAPMGPVGILCIKRTLNGGRKAGLFTGIGAAISDFFYCLLTGLGMSMVFDFVETNKTLLQILGSAMLLVYALFLILKKSSNNNKNEELHKGHSKNNHINDLITGFFFTVSNPLILFLILGFFARFNFLQPEFMWFHYVAGYIFIIVGALLWWFIITFFVDKIRYRFSERTMVVLNRVIGVVILIMSIVGFVTAINDILKIVV